MTATKANGIGIAIGIGKDNDSDDYEEEKNRSVVSSAAVLGQPILLSLLYYNNHFNRLNQDVQNSRDKVPLGDETEPGQGSKASVSPSLSTRASLAGSDILGGSEYNLQRDHSCSDVGLGGGTVDDDVD